MNETTSTILSVIAYFVLLVVLIGVYMLLEHISTQQHEAAHAAIFKQGCVGGNVIITDNFKNWSLGKTDRMGYTRLENSTSCAAWVDEANALNEVVGYNLMTPLNLVAACMLMLTFMRFSKVLRWGV